MSDSARKPLSDQIGQSLKPDSQKTTTEKLGDTVSGTYDRAASAVQPDSQKSNTQHAADSLRGGKDETENQGKGVVETVKEYANAAAQSASETLNNLTGSNNNNNGPKV